MGNGDTLGPRIAQRLRKLAEQLASRPAAPRRTEHQLDAAEAELLEDGSLLFTSEDPTQQTGWWIFFRPGSQRGEIPAVFSLRGAVPAALPSEEFVCAAYASVLAREADGDGRRMFTGLLEAGKIAQLGVLESLVTSAEARRKNDQFVLVPKPSQWLPDEHVAPPDVAGHKIVIRGWPATRKAPSALQLYPGYAEGDLAIFEEFRNPAARAQPGFVVDFLGGRIRVSSLWASARNWDGQLLGIPVPADYHAEAVEWIGLLKSVKTANTQYVAMELGAGFGPWSIAGGVAARRIGIASIRLCAVEADPQHFRSLRQNFVDNGFDPDSHTLIEAAVGVAAGMACWPALDDSSNEWGSRPIIGQGNRGRSAQDYLGRSFAETIEVRIVPMLDLVRREPRWDLVHIDVQGTEVDIVRSAIDELNERAHWMVIGTHSRKIDGDLIEMLAGADWLLEHEKPAKFTFQPGAATLEAMTILDGTQVWRNPRWSGA